MDCGTHLVVRTHILESMGRGAGLRATLNEIMWKAVAGDKDGIRSRRKRLEVRVERTEEVMVVDDTVRILDRKLYINRTRR